jgi:Glycosyl hydrolase family 76
MISDFDHRRWVLAPSGALLMLMLWAALVLCAAPGAHAAAGRSPYPAAATRPAFRPRPSEYARTTRASGAGASADRAVSGHGATSSGGSAAPGSASPGSASAPAKKPAKAAKPTLHGNPARALAAFEAMQKQYYIKGSGLYQGEPFAYLFPFSQALAATVSMANIAHLGVSLTHELRARLVGLGSYLDLDNAGAAQGTYTSTLAAFDGTVAPPTGPGGPKYYDDNDWVGIELMRLYRLNHSQATLGSAEGIMAFEMAAWQSGPTLACPGGIPFANTPENNQRNTVTTAPAAELALQLYRVTRNPQYLQFAEMAYEWVRACLTEPNGLYADHIGRHGTVEPMLWSYNQGSMIGAGTLLYQITGNPAFLYEARQTAKAALNYFTPERLGSEIPFFASVYFRNLMYLDSVTHDPPGAAIAQNYVNYAWQHLRLRDDVFVAGSPAGAQLLVQAAIVQIYALLSTPASTYF